MSEVKVTNRITVTLAGQEIEISQKEAEELHRSLGAVLGIGLIPNNPYSDQYNHWRKRTLEEDEWEKLTPVRYSDKATSP